MLYVTYKKNRASVLARIRDIIFDYMMWVRGYFSRWLELFIEIHVTQPIPRWDDINLSDFRRLNLTKGRTPITHSVPRGTIPHEHKSPNQLIHAYDPICYSPKQLKQTHDLVRRSPNRLKLTHYRAYHSPTRLKQTHDPIRNPFIRFKQMYVLHTSHVHLDETNIIWPIRHSPT